MAKDQGRAGPPRPTPADLSLLGGSPSLDFANTVVWRLSDRPREALTGYGDLLIWAGHAGVLTEEQTRLLAEEAARRPADAAAALGRAVALREAIYRIFAAIAQGAPAPAEDLATLNVALATAMSRAGVVAAEGGYRWGWPAEALDLDRPLWPVARAAAELLTTADPRRVRRCGGTGCGWLFLDTSRNGSRRWCEMQVCGNRARVRSHYQRKRAKKAAALAGARSE